MSCITGNKKLIQMKLRSFLFPLFCFLLLSPLLSYSQKRIDILNAGSLKSDNNIANGAKRLIGDVRLKHEAVLMFCDSAYLYSDNSMDAFGHVHIQQADSIHLYGDFLKYNGNTKKAVLTKNVIVDKGDMRLTTQELIYSIATSIGSYVVSAKIVNKENVLTSEQGYFFAKTNDLTFKKNVVLTNPQFVINCDTMRYNTSSRITYFKGPTTIKSKENLIYCEDGWYDTSNDLSRFSKNSYILTQQQKMLGDSLYYDRKKGIGKAKHNVQIIDTTQKLTITGNLALHYEFEDLSIVTGRALLIQISDRDTLYLHADTLKALGESSKDTLMIKKIKQSKSKKETSAISKRNDSTYSHDNQKLFAYHKVKFFRKDLQGKCDSLIYTTIDSTMKLFGKPVIWSEENQLTADSIKLITGEKSIKTLELNGTGFIVSSGDSLHFNQIRGKYMKGFFADNKLLLVNVEGNGQTIYYPKDKKELKAANRADCSDLRILFKDEKIDRITFITKPEATLYPMDKVDVKELKLKDFIWRVKERPNEFRDIFN
jgi:lipopolysaccharide export system protein LptA